MATGPVSMTTMESAPRGRRRPRPIVLRVARVRRSLGVGSASKVLVPVSALLLAAILIGLHLDDLANALPGWQSGQLTHGTTVQSSPAADAGPEIHRPDNANVPELARLEQADPDPFHPTGRAVGLDRGRIVSIEPDPPRYRR